MTLPVGRTRASSTTYHWGGAHLPGPSWPAAPSWRCLRVLLPLLPLLAARPAAL